MAPDPYKYFRLEARDILDQFAKGVLALEQNGGTQPVIQQLLRLAHTLKGAARVVKQPEIAHAAHQIEDVLSPFRDEADGVRGEQVDAILKHLETVGQRVRALAAAPEEGAATPVPAKAGADDGQRIVRADVAEMDALLNGVAETHAHLSGLRRSFRTVEQAQHMADLLVEQLSPRGSDRAASIAEELRKTFGGLGRHLSSGIDQMDRELGQLRAAAEQLRLAAAASLFTTLERTARDTARMQGKQVVFEGTGGDIRLDADVLGTIQGALVQITRNAIAHGIENPDVRRRAGKPAAGRVSIDVSRRGRHIVFTCADDGSGVDIEAVRRVAAHRGLADSGSGLSDVEELVRLLLQGGISTSPAVTEVSGRGIGLDVVREAVSRQGGTVAIRTVAGKGTTFELVVPSSLASVEALLVEASACLAAVPLDAVRRSIRVAAAEIAQSPLGSAVFFQGKAIPFVPLSRLLGGGHQPRVGNWTAIVVAGAGGFAAVGVDRLRDTARIVVRPLPDHAPASAIIAGAFLDAEGNPQLVLDPDGLVAEVQQGGAPEPALPPKGHPVLVVDDSLTTRMLEQSILESAGYEVDVALSGEEALEKARRRRYALFLVDVEMPGMDGFTFIEHIRSDPALYEIPAILVTSRGAPEDRQRGRDVKAQGYVIKSEFDQAELLSLIRSLVG